MLVAAMIASAHPVTASDDEHVARLSSQSQNAYLACIAKHLPPSPKEMSAATSLTATQHHLADKAVEACNFLRLPAVSYAIYLRALRQSPETASVLRMRVEKELGELVEGRVRSSFNIGWVQ